MNEEPKTTNFEAEPVATGMTVPVWLFALMLCVFFMGALTFDLHGGWFRPEVYGPYASIEDLNRYQPVKGNDPTIRGRILFEANCALCHGTDGMGKPGQAPPFVGSEWVLAAGVNRMARIPSFGLAGNLTVKGQQFNLSMAAMGAQYNDDDLAAILSYIRTAWGNKASLVAPEEVHAARAAAGARTQPYSMEELLKLPEK